MTRNDVFARNWTDPKYLALHRRKERVWADLKLAYFMHRKDDVARLEAAYGRAVQRITRFEDRALRSVGLHP